MKRLEDELFESVSFKAKIRVVEEFLTSRLRKNIKTYDMNRISTCIEIINRSKGMVDTATLASAACLSRKQFERVFSEYIGTSPKQFLKSVWFQYSLFGKQRNGQIALIELAYQCGYYDQSHMINEYKVLSVKAPSQFFAECEPMSDYFQ